MRAVNLREALGEVELAALVQTLLGAHGDVEQAAENLGLSKSSMRRRMQKHGVSAYDVRRWGADAFPAHRWPITIGAGVHFYCSRE